MKRIIPLVLLLFLNYAAAPTHYRSPENSTGIILGFTDWSCYDPAPMAAVTAEVVMADYLEAREVAKHELKHKEQMLRYGTCVRWMMALIGGGWEFGVNIEAEAFCATAREAYRNGRYATLDAAIHKFSDNMMLYGFPITREEAEDKIHFYCQKEL